jgi:hypothetical protein
VLFLPALPAQHLAQLAPQQAQEQAYQQDDATYNTNTTALSQVRKLLEQLLQVNGAVTPSQCPVTALLQI